MNEREQQERFMEVIRHCSCTHKGFAGKAAEKFGVTPQSIGKWENGIVKPSSQFRQKILSWIAHEYEDNI